MTSITNVWGTFGIAVLLGSLFGVWFSTRKTRVTVFAIVTALAYVSVFFKTTGVVNYLYALYDVPALSTICLAPLYLIWNRRPKEFQGNKAPLDNSGSNLNRETLALKIALILLGLILYASEFNAFTFDVYCLGYSANLALIVTCVALLPVVNRTFLLIIALCYCAYKVGLYVNYYDSILDVGLWLYLVVTSCAQLIRTFSRKHKTSNTDADIPVNEVGTSNSSERKKLVLRR